MRIWVKTKHHRFSFHDGKLSCRYLRQYIELGSEEMEHPLSDAQIAALDLFDEMMMAPEMRIDMMMEPGDISWPTTTLCCTPHSV